MRIKKAFKVLISNFKLIYKSAFARLFFTALFCLIGYLAISEHVMPIVEHETTLNVFYATRDLFVKFFAGEGIETDRLPEAMSAFMGMLADQRGQIFIAVTEVFCIVLALRIIVNMFEYAYAKVMNGFMSARSRYGVLTTLFLDLGKAFLYSLIYVIINFIIEIAIIIVSIAILVGGLKIISVFAILLAFAFLSTSLAFKRSITSSFLPNIVVEGMPIRKALANTSPKNRKHFASLFGSYFFLLLIIYYLNVSFAIFTFFTALTITIPVSGLFLTATSLVDKYLLLDKRFYTDEEHIAGGYNNSKDACYTKLMED